MLLFLSCRAKVTRKLMVSVSLSSIEYPNSHYLYPSSALEGLSALTVQETPQDLFSSPSNLDGDLVTLTLLPRSRWQTLLNLEVIQVCLPIIVFPIPACSHDALNSNGISPKIHQNRLNKRPSSCPHCRGWSTASPSTKSKSRSRIKQREDSIKSLRRLRASSSRNLPKPILRATVSALSSICFRPPVFFLANSGDRR